MKKLYKEQHYKQYCEYMDAIANEDDFVKGMKLNESFKEWLYENRITTQMEEQMEERLEQEDMDELNGVKKEGKVIQFPKKD